MPHASTRRQDPVEDTKGNNGDQGELHATNLRLMWVSKKSKRTNISIGYNCVTAINVKEANSRLKGLLDPVARHGMAPRMVSMPPHGVPR